MAVYRFSHFFIFYYLFIYFYFFLLNHWFWFLVSAVCSEANIGKQIYPSTRQCSYLKVGCKEYSSTYLHDGIWKTFLEFFSSTTGFQ